MASDFKTLLGGFWDNQTNWSAGLPNASSDVTIGPLIVGPVVAAGMDTFLTLNLQGAPAVGGVITGHLDVTGSLIDTAGNNGTASINNFELDVAKDATYTTPQIGEISASLLNIAGTANVFYGANGGFIGITGSTIIVDATGTLNTTELTSNATDSLIVNGVVNVTGGSNAMAGTHVTINAGGTLDIAGTDNDTTVYQINGGAYAAGAAYSHASFNFNGIAGGSVSMTKNAGHYDNQFNITNFANGDTLTLGSLATGSVLTTHLSGTDLTILSGGNVVAEVLNFTDVAGTQLGAHVVNGQITLDGCFYAGTSLATPDGAIAVEDVTAGTMLLTAAGEARAVRWLGRSTVSTRFRDPLRALPIRIKAGALGDGLPLRDLLVSPCHAMLIGGVLIGGVLIEAGALVNGDTVIRETGVPEVFTYFHVELDSHDLVLAEGAAAESFVDNIDRMHFQNWAEHEQFNTAPMQEMAYPRAKSFRQIPAAVRAMLAVRQAA